MIHLRLSGGLGNQLFQIGAAALIGQRSGLPIRILTNKLASYATPRKLQLPKIVDLEALRATTDARRCWLHELRLARLLPWLSRSLALVSDRNIVDAAAFGPVRRAYVDGYFVESLTQAVFDAVVPILRGALLLDAANAPRPAPGTCVVHIRGGDFLGLGQQIPDTLNYYRNAIAAVAARTPITDIVVATDDRAYADSLLQDLQQPYRFAEGSFVDDFHLLRQAPAKVLSNSTFAFFAASLRSDDGPLPVTVAPRLWRPGVERMLHLPGEVTL